MTPLDRWQVVMATRGLSGVEKAVLNCLAYHADETSLEAWPSLETLALETGFGRTACWHAVRALEACGAISAVAKSEGRHSNRYHLHLDETAAWRVVEPAATRTNRAENRSPRERLDLPPGEPQPAATRTRTCRQANANQVLNQVRNQDEKSFTSEDRGTAEWIFGLILAMHPGHRRPNLDAWAKDIRLMRERDGKTDAEVRELFVWANRDPFWKSNILSPATLRKQWDKLAVKRGANGRRGACADRTLDGPL